MARVGRHSTPGRSHRGSAAKGHAASRFAGGETGDVRVCAQLVDSAGARAPSAAMLQATKVVE